MKRILLLMSVMVFMVSSSYAQGFTLKSTDINGQLSQDQVLSGFGVSKNNDAGWGFLTWQMFKDFAEGMTSKQKTSVNKVTSTSRRSISSQEPIFRVIGG